MTYKQIIGRQSKENQRMAVDLTIKDGTQFPWSETDFADKVRNAVKAYWNARRKQAKKQRTPREEGCRYSR